MKTKKREEKGCKYVEQLNYPSHHVVLVERGVSAGILSKAALKKSNFNLLMAVSLPKLALGTGY